MNTCHHQIKLDICAIVSNCGQMSRAAFVQVKPYAQPILDMSSRTSGTHVSEARVEWPESQHQAP